MGDKSNGKWVNGANVDNAWRGFEKMLQGGSNLQVWAQASLPLISMIERTQRESIKAMQSACKAQAEAFQRCADTLNGGAVAAFWTTIEAMCTSSLLHLKSIADGASSKEPMDIVNANIQAWQDTAQRVMVDSTNLSQATTKAFQEMMAYKEPNLSAPSQAV